MPSWMRIVLGALLVAGVLGGVSTAALLVPGLVLKRRLPDRPEVGDALLQRSARTPSVLGVLAIGYPVVAGLLGRPWSAGSWSLVVGGLLLLALGSLLRALLPVRGPRDG